MAGLLPFVVTPMDYEMCKKVYKEEEEKEQDYDYCEDYLLSQVGYSGTQVNEDFESSDYDYPLFNEVDSENEYDTSFAEDMDEFREISMNEVHDEGAKLNKGIGKVPEEKLDDEMNKFREIFMNKVHDEGTKLNEEIERLFEEKLDDEMNKFSEEMSMKEVHDEGTKLNEGIGKLPEEKLDDEMNKKETENTSNSEEEKVDILSNKDKPDKEELSVVY